MKTRNGFVSNSSSSSFIIVWPHRPTSAQDVYDMMFGAGEFTIAAYGDALDPTAVARRVWNDIEALEQLPISRVAIAQQLESCAYQELWCTLDKMPCPYEQGIEPGERDKRQAAQDKLTGAHAEELTNCLLQHEGFICSLEYEDSGLFDTVMENSDVFRQLPHQRVNNH